MKSKRKEVSKKNNWIFTSVEDSMPPTGDGLCVLAINDETPGNCIPIGQVMNSTWFTLHFKEEKWTHWLLLPPRPMESTEKLLWSEIEPKHRVKLPAEYNMFLQLCRDCEREEQDKSETVVCTKMFDSREELRQCPYFCDIVGFARDGKNVMLVSQCRKCETRWFSHAYRKSTYLAFKNGEFK